MRTTTWVALGAAAFLVLQGCATGDNIDDFQSDGGVVGATDFPNTPWGTVVGSVSIDTGGVVTVGDGAGSVVVGRDYFRTSGVPILRGRGFTPADRLGEPFVAVVSQAMAAKWKNAIEAISPMKRSGSTRGRNSRTSPPRSSSSSSS